MKTLYLDNVHKMNLAFLSDSSCVVCFVCLEFTILAFSTDEWGCVGSVFQSNGDTTKSALIGQYSCQAYVILCQ